MQAEFGEQPLPSWRRAVLKVGSSLLAPDGGMLSDRHAAGLARFVSASLAAGREVVVVSSGAVAAGRPLVGARSERAAGIAARQALAALGQTRLIALWQGFFSQPVAQVLLTHDDLRNRRRYLNARSTLRELLALGAIPVINENDTVAVDELKLGDNDNLAAIVAALVDADLLLIASDIGGLYTANPRIDADAHPLDRVDAVTPGIMAMASGSGSARRHRRHADQARSGAEGRRGRYRDDPLRRHRCRRRRSAGERKFPRHAAVGLAHAAGRA